MTEYIRRVIVIVEASDQAAANAQAALLDPDTGGDKTLAIPLSASGSDPPTHFACDAACRLATYNAILGLQAAFPTSKIYRGYSDYDITPEPKYTFSEALADAGLKRIEYGIS